MITRKPDNGRYLSAEYLDGLLRDFDGLPPSGKRTSIRELASRIQRTGDGSLAGSERGVLEVLGRAVGSPEITVREESMQGFSLLAKRGVNVSRFQEALYQIALGGHTSAKNDALVALSFTDKNAFPTIMEVLTSVNTTETIATAISSLQNFYNRGIQIPDYMVDLVRRSLGSTADKVRWSAIASLGLFGSGSDAMMLSNYLSHDDPHTVWRSAEAIESLVRRHEHGFDPSEVRFRLTQVRRRISQGVMKSASASQIYHIETHVASALNAIEGHITDAGQEIEGDSPSSLMKPHSAIPRNPATLRKNRKALREWRRRQAELHRRTPYD